MKRARQAPRRNLRGHALLRPRARSGPGARRHPGARHRRGSRHAAAGGRAALRPPIGHRRHPEPPRSPVSQGRRPRAGASYEVPFRLPAIPGTETLDVPPERRAATTGKVGGSPSDRGHRGCPRFLRRRHPRIRIGPSPAWLRTRLEAVGVRSINNVVDATNYVMLELNQPMHAYDVARLRGPALIVPVGPRPARRLVTLDGVERTLDAEMTVIADGGGRDRRRRGDGRRRHRGERRRPATCSSSAPTWDPRRYPPHPSRARPEHRGQLSVRARHRPLGRRRSVAPLHRDHRCRDRRRPACRRAARSLARAVAIRRVSSSVPRA